MSSRYDVLHYRRGGRPQCEESVKQESVVSRLAMVTTRFTYKKLLKHAKLCSYMKIYEISYEVS